MALGCTSSPKGTRRRTSGSMTSMKPAGSTTSRHVPIRQNMVASRHIGGRTSSRSVASLGGLASSPQENANTPSSAQAVKPEMPGL